ncbi:MAG: hypothetical protein Q7T11_00745, partial [Deltaproteobacteria bacterium]|nr:hypothetical protein [Deltaproteobacteria bacterium]
EEKKILCDDFKKEMGRDRMMGKQDRDSMAAAAGEVGAGMPSAGHTLCMPMPGGSRQFIQQVTAYTQCVQAAAASQVGGGPSAMEGCTSDSCTADVGDVQECTEGSNCPDGAVAQQTTTNPDDGSQTVTSINDQGEPVQVQTTNADGQETSRTEYKYDGNGDMTKKTDTRTAYGSNGNKTKETTTTTEYGADGKPKSSKTTTTDYDKDGKPKTTTTSTPNPADDSGGDDCGNLLPGSNQAQAMGNAIAAGLGRYVNPNPEDTGGASAYDQCFGGFGIASLSGGDCARVSCGAGFILDMNADNCCSQEQGRGGAGVSDNSACQMISCPEGMTCMAGGCREGRGDGLITLPARGGGIIPGPAAPGGGPGPGGPDPGPANPTPVDGVRR